MDPIGKLSEAAEAEVCRRRAETNFKQYPLALTDEKLVTNGDAIARTRETLTWVATIRSAAAPHPVCSSLLSSSASSMRERLATVATSAMMEIKRLRSSIAEVKLTYDIEGFDYEVPSELSRKLDDLLSRPDELTQYLELLALGSAARS
jgi:hypothetical protein